MKMTNVFVLDNHQHNAILQNIDCTVCISC